MTDEADSVASRQARKSRFDAFLSLGGAERRAKIDRAIRPVIERMPALMVARIVQRLAERGITPATIRNLTRPSKPGNELLTFSDLDALMAQCQSDDCASLEVGFRAGLEALVKALPASQHLAAVEQATAWVYDREPPLGVAGAVGAAYAEVMFDPED